MDAIDKTNLTADLRQLIATAPVSAVFGSVTASCFRSKVNALELFSDYGAVEQYEFTLRSVTADFSTIPKTGDTFTISGVSYRVLRVESTMLGVSLLIHCGGISQ